jgi:hypothetical protein
MLTESVADSSEKTHVNSIGGLTQCVEYTRLTGYLYQANNILEWIQYPRVDTSILAYKNANNYKSILSHDGYIKP